MIAGRSGSQKSGFALWLCEQWGLPTLYLSGDMSPFTASSRIASMHSGKTLEEIEAIMAAGGRDREALLESIADSKIKFAFGSPITGQAVDSELDAWVELHDSFPDVVVIDNLMDYEGAESEYVPQMGVMQSANELARDLGATVIVMHHASDKSWDAKTAPFNPPSRQEIKNGLSEKPALSLGVALDPNSLDFHIATLKQRMGPQDPTGRRFITLRCEPERTRFHKKGGITIR